MSASSVNYSVSSCVAYILANLSSAKRVHRDVLPTAPAQPGGNKQAQVHTGQLK